MDAMRINFSNLCYVEDIFIYIHTSLGQLHDSQAFFAAKKEKILLFCYISYTINLKTPRDKLFPITNKARISLLVAQFQDPIQKG